MLNIIICDTSSIHHEVLANMIGVVEEESTECFILERYYRPNRLLEWLEKSTTTVDVAFIDILMRDVDGVALAKELKNKFPHIAIVFLAETEKYAIKGYEVRAIDYLLKPYSRQKIKELLISVIEDKRIREQERAEAIIVKTAEGVTLVYEGTIKYIETDDKKLNIYTLSQGCIVIKKKLDDMYLELTDGRFLKPHRSFIVNMDFIQSIEKYYFELYTGERIDIKQREYAYYKRQWLQYVIEKYKKQEG